MKLYSLTYTSSFNKEKMYAEIYASTEDSAKEYLDLDSMEWASAKITDWAIIEVPKEGQILTRSSLEDHLSGDEYALEDES